MVSNKFIMSSGQPTQKVVTGKMLPLNLQFFAGDPPNDPPAGDPPNDPPNDPPDDDDPVTFEELLKQHPEYKKAHNEKIEKAVKRRLKNHTPKDPPNPNDPPEGDPPNDQTIALNKAQQRAAKLESRTKALEVAAFASAQEGFTADHVKLIERLSANRIGELELDDDGKLDADEVGDMVDAIVEEFPSLFAVADANAQTSPDGTTKRKTHTPGPPNQQTNKIPPSDKGVAKMTERMERLKKKGRI